MYISLYSSLPLLLFVCPSLFFFLYISVFVLALSLYFGFSIGVSLSQDIYIYYNWLAWISLHAIQMSSPFATQSQPLKSLSQRLMLLRLLSRFMSKYRSQLEVVQRNYNNVQIRSIPPQLKGDHFDTSTYLANMHANYWLMELEWPRIKDWNAIATVPEFDNKPTFVQRSFNYWTIRSGAG